MKNKIFTFMFIAIFSALLPLSVFADNADIEKEKKAYEEAQFETEALRDGLMQAKNSYEYAQQHPDEEGMRDILAVYPEMIAQSEKNLEEAEKTLAQAKTAYDNAKKDSDKSSDKSSDEPTIVESSDGAEAAASPNVSEVQTEQQTASQAGTQVINSDSNSSFYLDLLAAAIVALILIGIRMYAVKKIS
ncbi:MAG: hypothetical protein IJ736_00380 [Firmicutes bacterium]|nr:hypothetical protein [Bacillota bacterium]